VALVRVHKKLGAILVHRKAEMVRDRLMHSKTRGPAESRGHIDPLGPMTEISGGTFVAHVTSFGFDLVFSFLFNAAADKR
jgi:hypothetical protein